MDRVNPGTTGPQVTLSGEVKQSDGANQYEHWGSESDPVKRANENGVVMSWCHGEWG